MIKITVFVPKDSAQKVKEAMFKAGAGKQGAYELCCFESQGRGQFLPLEGAHPALGKIGEVEYVDELRLEMLCQKEHIKAVVKALRAAHPYEEPAFDLVELMAIEDLEGRQ